MDVKQEIEKIVEKIQKDQSLQAQFKKDPAKAVESLVGVELPKDAVEKIVAGVKAKISVNDIQGAVGALKKLL